MIDKTDYKYNIFANLNICKHDVGVAVVMCNNIGKFISTKHEKNVWYVIIYEHPIFFRNVKIRWIKWSVNS